MRFLLDEHIPIAYGSAIRQVDENVGVIRIGDVGAPKLHTLDPDILVWCEENDYVLVTNNRQSMPTHLDDHLAKERKSPGIFVVNLEYGIGVNAAELVLMARAALPGEYEGKISYGDC
jgi:hypothetical protein